MFPPIFETKPPFVIRVYENNFQITWEDAIPVPEDNYPYKNISSVSVKRSKKNYDGIWLVFILKLFIRSHVPIETDDHDEVLIKFKSGAEEIRYIQGVTTPSINEAIELISAKLK